MPFLRNFIVFILSFIFTTSVLIAITSYNLGGLIQIDSFKNIIKTESVNFIDEECQEKCGHYTDYKEACTSLCQKELNDQIQETANKAIDEIYKTRIFNISLEEVFYFISNYILFAFIGIFSGIFLLFASKTPFLTTGKNFIMISFTLFISSATPYLLLASSSLPIDLGKIIKDYFSSGFNQQIQYGFVFLIVGIFLIIINYIINRKKSKKRNSFIKQM